MFYYKLRLMILPRIAKVTENKYVKHVYLGTMVLRLQTYKKWGREGDLVFHESIVICVFPKAFLYCCIVLEVLPKSLSW